jgi:hypothetical protein
MQKREPAGMQANPLHRASFQRQPAPIEPIANNGASVRCQLSPQLVPSPCLWAQFHE